MKSKKKWLSIIISVLLLVSLISVPAEASVKVKSQTKSITMVKGQKYSIKPSVKMSFKSSNSKIASVNSSGVITAKTNGNAVVSGKYKKVTWKYNVRVDSPKINEKSLTLTTGSSKQLKLSGTKCKVSWSSSSPSVASVSSKGKVVARNTGKAIIVAKVNGVKFSCRVSVKSASPKQEYVWIVSAGKKYHNNPNCSKMNSPQKVTIQYAKNLGYGACKKCYS